MRIVGILVLLLLSAVPAALVAGPATFHPRLWIDPTDSLRLRQWAVGTNPMWEHGLHQLAVSSAAEMDAGSIPGDDNEGSTYSPVNTEAYAALFAFMANVDPNETARAEWALRARTLLFYVLDRVDACMRSTPPVAGDSYCDDAFPVSDRSRWQGAAFPLAVDWLMAATLPSGQPALNAADKAEIRRVFIWWSYLNLEAYPNPYNNPPQDSLPVGTIGEPLLRLDDPRRYRLRFAGNNYFAGHMRQLGLMAIALDAADDIVDPLSPATYLKRNASGELQEYPFNDANGRLTGFLRDALDGWLYMQDYLLGHDARGGLPAEGMEYAATSLGIPAHFLFALETAGRADSDAQLAHGARVAGFDTNPFYRAIVPGYLHSLSPSPASNPDRGEVYWPAWYGDGEHYYQSDSIDILAPLGLHAARIGDTRTLDAIRWIQRHVPPGGGDSLLSRARNSESLLRAILYFMLFDPAAASSGEDAPDPRSAFPLSFWSDGLGRLLSRSDWNTSASWFDFKLGWDTVDHQHGDGLMIELYRNGEWLTKSALGYGLEGGATDYKNSLSVENTIAPGIDGESALARRLRRGAQMPQNRASADPVVLSRSEDAAYSFLAADATALYNAWYDADDPTPIDQRAADVDHVSRSVIWLKPDVVVAYDRASTHTAGRFKRVWLNMPDRLPSLPTIVGDRATGTTPNGQQLIVTSLLPSAKTLAIVTHDAEINLDRGNLWSLGDEDPILQERQYVDPVSGNPVPDTYESYATRLRIDATGGPADVRFLTVLEGANAAAAASPTTLVRSVSTAGCNAPANAFEGTAIGSHVVVFRRDLGSTFECLAYDSLASAHDHVVSGLAPWGAYSYAQTIDGENRRVFVTSGGAARADGGGVFRFDPAVAATPQARLIIEGDDLHADELAFSTVAVGDERQRLLRIFNRGSAALSLASITIGDNADLAYSLSGACTTAGLSLGPDASCDLTIRFHPTGLGFRSSGLTVTSNSPSVAIRLAGTAIDPPSADAIFDDGFDAATR